MENAAPLGSVDTDVEGPHSGDGVRKWAGHTYNGSFDHGKFHGKGELVWSNGSKYIGDFVCGKMEGVGRLTFDVDSLIFPAQKGDTYHGEWKASRWHGRGCLRNSTRQVLKAGRWEANELVQTQNELDTIALQGRLDTDGFVLLPIHGSDPPTWEALKELIGSKNTLQRAWKVNHPVHRDFYESGLERVATELKRFEANQGKQAAHFAAPGLPTITAKVAKALLQPLRSSANETMLLHGTTPAVVLSVLSQGLTEKFAGKSSGTKHGKGVYFAEDIRKSDAYAQPDMIYDAESDCHKYLYPSAADHPGEVRYLFVCRVSLGIPLRTTETGQGAKDIDNGAPVFPSVYGELTTVHGVSPPMHYHSLIAEKSSGAAFREFIVFRNEYISVEYLIAYSRGKPAGAP